MFFEGNDLKDIGNEYQALVRWRETGQRDFREFIKQPSLVRVLYKAVRNGYQLLHGTIGCCHCLFQIVTR